LAITNNAAILARGTNTPLPINTSIPLPTSVIGLNMPLIDPRKRPKYTTLYLERFIGKDESIYSIFRSLLEAKLQTNAQAISREYKQV
jgi:hypothetical protein